MIARLAGTVIDKEGKSLVLDVQGVGYRVAVLQKLLKVVALEETLVLRIYHQVSDDNEALYGFNEARDLEFFELLLKVPSVGPRTALNILDIASPDTLTQAVNEADTTLLTKVSGVGKKTAQRIVVELKGKIADKGGTRVMPGQVQQETIEALVSLGYTAGEARKLVAKLPTSTTSVEGAVRAVLREKAQ